MGAQYNKVIKRKRRESWIKRKLDARNSAKAAKKAKAPAEAPAA